MPISVPPRLEMPLFRCILAVLALVSQLVLGSITDGSRAVAATNAGIDAATILCLPSHHLAATDRRHRPAQGTAAIQIVSLELSAILVPAAPAVPAMPSLAGDPARRQTHPRAPPALFATAFRARAPPVPA